MPPPRSKAGFAREAKWPLWAVEAQLAKPPCSFRPRQSTFICWFAVKARRNNVPLSGEANRRATPYHGPMFGSSDGSHRGPYLKTVRWCERAQGDRAQDLKSLPDEWGQSEHRLARWLPRARCERIHRDEAQARVGGESHSLCHERPGHPRGATCGETPWTELLRASAKDRSSCMRSTPGLGDFLSDFTPRNDLASSTSRSTAETEPAGDLPIFTKLNSWSAERAGSVLHRTLVDMWRPL
jgi:hypothetical protein